MLVNHPSRYYNAITYLMEKTDMKKVLRANMTVDLETTGLDPWHGDRLCGIAIECEGEGFYFPFRHGVGMGEINIPLKRLQDFKSLLSKENTTYLGHNYKFDLQMLYVDKIPMPKRIEDTQLAAHLMNENEYDYDKDGKVRFRDGKPVTMFRLKELGDRYIGAGSSGEEKTLGNRVMAYGYANTMKETKGNMWKLPPEAVASYAIQDVFLTKQLRDFYVPHLKNWKLLDIWRETNEYELVATWMEIYGMHIDIDLMREYMADSHPKAEMYAAKLVEIAGYALNPRSSKQINTLLQLASSKKEVLETLRDSDDPLVMNPNYTLGETIKIVEAFRSYDKVNANYYDKYERMMDKNYNLHYSIFLTGTISGRWSVGDPPMQAVPRYSEIYRVKDVFVARPGYTLVEADLSQAEMRLATDYADEATMKDKIMRGADVHTETAEELDIPRDGAKRINFGVIYRIGKIALARQLHITEELASKYLNKYHGMYPGFRALAKICEAMATHRGYIRLWTGRVRRYDKYNDPYKAMSNLIQGGIAEVIRHCILRNYRDLTPKGVRMLLQVHDSIMFEVLDEILFDVLPIISKNMTDFDFGVPMKVDIKYGKRWGSMTKWKED